jgi:hypothetical protein
MLGTEEFLGNFEPVDEVSNRPTYLNDFTLAQPDCNDGGPGDQSSSLAILFRQQQRPRPSTRFWT